MKNEILNLLKKGTIDNMEEYELFKKESDGIRSEDYGECDVISLRIEFNGGCAEIYELEENEDPEQQIRFENYIDGEVFYFEDAYELTEYEVVVKYKDEIIELLEDISRQIFQEGNNLTYTIYYHRTEFDFWIMDHTGNSWIASPDAKALGSYSYQYADASSDFDIEFFFEFLKDKHDIDIAKAEEPDYDNEDEELDRLYEEYSERLDELKEKYWDEYIDELIDEFAWQWVESEYDNLLCRWKGL